MTQLNQMHSSDKELKGYNLWFTIEILSFYGYLFSAILFIFEYSVSSSLGWIDKKSHMMAYQYDFIEYHRVSLDWFAIIFIVFFVNVWLLVSDANIQLIQPKGVSKEAS